MRAAGVRAQQSGESVTVDHTWWLEALSDEAIAQTGLASTEAQKRMAQSGPNLFRTQHQQPLLLQYLARFRNPLVIILLAASAVSAFTGELANFLIISVIILLSVSLDFVQEHRANTAADKLRQSVAVQANVMRDGKLQLLPVEQIVPGDVLQLVAGDMVPADGRVLASTDFFVKQALLTGESYPVEKHAGTLPATATDMQEASNAVFMGTSVVSGSARMQAVKTGTGTAIGAIADTLSHAAEPTSFEIGTRRFGVLIMRLTIAMVLFVLFANGLMHKPWLDSFLFAVALAVGLTPELLPMIISVTLARGALRMAKQNMIVKRLAAIQDLGSMDVLCTDKTGTLTEAKIRMERHVDAAGMSSERVLELAYLNSFFESGLKNPLDEAILEHAEIATGTWTKIDEVPFDFERRCVSVLLDDGTRRALMVKGAPDEILALCTRYETAGAHSDQPLDAAALVSVRAQYHALEEEGFRVLGIAWREESRALEHAVVGDESELVLAGFAAFLDPPKLSAAPALEALSKLGVGIKIVTGDSDLVTRHVCAELNIPVIGLLTGKEIARLDDYALRAQVERTNLFCRVNPAQKDRIILALKTNGHVVGYLGDGINDAPSLHSADVGLSVDSAVDVAKEAADMILLKPDLQVLHAAVLEGRRTFSNIMKYIMMGTSSNFGNMFSMAGAALFLPFLPMLPTQILLNNILYDISEIPIPLDDVDAEALAAPRVLDLGFIRNFMLIVGPVSSLFDFLTFYVLLVLLKADAPLFQTGWFIESLCSQVLVIFIIRTRGNPFRSRPHAWLIASSLAVLVLALLLPYTPVGSYFGFTPPPLRFYLILGAVLVVYLFAVELAKRAFYRWFARSKRGQPALGMSG